MIDPSGNPGTAAPGFFGTAGFSSFAFQTQLFKIPLATHGRAVTYTCVPPGSGERIGVDRDGDGFWDGDERDAHSDPADPASTP